MRYFVTYSGNLEEDPLDCGSESYSDYQSAKDFADRMRNKGLTCDIYCGKIVDEDERDRREQNLAEMAMFDQEMRLYESIRNPLIKDQTV